MVSKLPTRWDIRWEEELIATWEKEGRFKTKVRGDRPVFVIDTPPPYLSSNRPHIGQTASYAHFDMIARFLRMRGVDVVFPFYLDRNGLPIEVQVEKKYGIVAHEVPREQFIKLCKEELDRYEGEFVSSLRRWGLSFDYWPQGTDSPEYRRMTQKTFIDLWHRGLVYEAERPTPWCPRCRTALAEPEIEYKEEETYLNYIKFRVKETGEDIVIATTRPELLPATVAVIFHPEDDRYKRLEGLHAVVPPEGQVVPILPHRAANPKFGTGLVMISTFGDTRDLMIVNELKLPIRIVVDEAGRIKEGRYAGLTVREARAKIVEDLKREGLLVKQERLVHNVPVCWRCKTPLEIIVTRELFIRQVEFKEKLVELAQRMEFKPPEYRQVLIDWIRSLELDWPVSRRRYYATEIPIWWCIKPNGERVPILPKGGEYYVPWRQEPPPEVKEQCKDGVLEGDTRVFDTWMDSSISWMYASGVTKEFNVFPKVYPHSIMRPQGYDIIRTWLYYSLLRAFLLFGDIPFKYVRINGMGLDEKGEAMHKSKGNVIDLLAPVEKYGADAVRFWAAAAGKLGSDYRYNENVIREGKEFVTKVWNIARFVTSFPKPQGTPSLTPVDKAILAKLYDVAKRAIAAYSDFDVYEPAHLLYNFIWHEFADHYIELAKSRAYNRGGEFAKEEQEAAIYTLHTVMAYSFKLLAPIMPFVTDKIWREVYGRSIHDEAIEDPPEAWREGDAQLFDMVKAINSAVWRYKNRKGLSLADPLDRPLCVPEKALAASKDLKYTHKVPEVKAGPCKEPIDEEGLASLD
ncbi:valine--tRNA ligase [Pyrobaculum calidifontis]|uniref:Valine--tRNA ligase n=1 Tax=Pyrobaculum calidifontis (strain DSM 21063 / JCM 11548 / VA1) TaxID=410359 RepID=A3MWP9_PYRCJ|nr:valine--tRNA ligase [Pyrobaculum calidifontis]ABO09066.1 valyl-tRNA synthetase [Pyrobaculum calidifontis JCM 11548]